MATQGSGGHLAGKVAVVTGATSESGRAIARRFVAEGADVVMLARGKERLLDEADRLGERFGRVDVLVNNAAVYRPCLVEELSDHDITTQLHQLPGARAHVPRRDPAAPCGRRRRHREHLQ